MPDVTRQLKRYTPKVSSHSSGQLLMLEAPKTATIMNIYVDKNGGFQIQVLENPEEENPRTEVTKLVAVLDDKTFTYDPELASLYKIIPHNDNTHWWTLYHMTDAVGE